MKDPLVGLIGELELLVAVSSVPAYLRGDTMVIPLRWVATGPADQLLPAMDANLELDPTPDGHCRLTLSGNYAPPLGQLGVRLDQVLLHRAGPGHRPRPETRVSHVIFVAHPVPADAPPDPAVDHLGRTDPDGPDCCPCPRPSSHRQPADRPTPAGARSTRGPAFQR